MKKGAFLISLLLALATFSQQTYAQGVWKSLSEVTYKISKDNFGELYVPVFSENIKKLEGKVVEADGYIIPFFSLAKRRTQLIKRLLYQLSFFEDVHQLFWVSRVERQLAPYFHPLGSVLYRRSEHHFHDGFRSS